jgi:RsiW-degrading membrane proteinase PrsW (M82 family)
MNWATNFAPAIVPIVLPAIFWAGYHYYKDRHLPEPIAHLALAFSLGVLSFWFGTLLYAALEVVNLRFDAYELAEANPAGLFFYVIFAIGLIEEGVKILPFVVVVLRFREFDEPIDGIIYASFIALGFAAVENLHYLQYVTGMEAMARGFAGPVVHIVFASIWGYYIGCAWLDRKRLLHAIFGSLAVTALLHGAYDYIAIALPATALPLAALLILGIWLWRLRLIRHLHRRSGHDLPANDGMPRTR